MRSRIEVRSTAEVVRSAMELPPARRRVLDAVTRSGHPVSVAELAEALACHISTVRPHLGALVAAGLLETSERRLGGRGRPATMYSARLPDPGRIHAGLVHLLTSGLDRVNVELAYDLGYEWGTDERQKDLGEVDGAKPSDVVVILIRLGFDPVWEQEDLVHIRSCPLRHRSADEDRNLWALHRGLFEGLLGTGHGSIAFRPDDPRSGCVVEFVPEGCPTE
nr:helix-turn-helix domain-containing protein [Actinomycetales bacterium]